MSIRPLPKDVVDRIKSSSEITSLNQVVCGLLTNSLDACCTKVNISLDYVLGNCTVQDNGLGIEPSEFEQDGGLCKLHHTSKSPPNPNIHGSHGNFIASVATLSLLTATSHHRHHASQASLSVHNGKVLARHVPALPDQRFELFSHGTRINIRNLFGSMPVRVKQRGLLFSDRVRLAREWESLMRDIAGLLLAWPTEVSISLREANTQWEQRLRSGNNEFVSRISRIFTQSGLAGSEDAGSWVPVSASCRRVRIKGAISTNPVATRRSQIMSLGIRPIPNSFGTNVLYEEANKLFQGSNFGVVDTEEHIGGIPGKPRKGIERWPMFYLEIHLLGTDEDLAMEDVLGDSKHSLQAIIDLLKVVCYGFLKKHLLQPKQIQRIAEVPVTARTRHPPRRVTRQSISEGQKSSRLPSAATPEPEPRRPCSPFDAWNRLKVGRAVAEPKVAYQSVESPATADKPTTRRLVGDNGVLLQRPFDDAAEIEVSVQSPHTNEPEVLVEATTEKNNTKSLEVDSKAETSSPKTRLTRPVEQISEGRPKAQPQEWLQNIIRSWKNPVFELTEPRIPSLDQAIPVERPVNANYDGPCSKFYAREYHVQFESAAMALNGRLSRTSLAQAEVIGQVDKKFLLLRLPLHTPNVAQGTEASSTLIMLDQHAADERCRLEELMSQYFQLNPLRAVTELLEKPIVFEVSAREYELLGRFHSHFRTWGIMYVMCKTSSMGEHQIEIKSLPPSILERCRTEPKLVIDLVRKETWKLEDRTIPPQPVYEPGKPWVSSFHNCPQGILELLHSRSCRSAIMFNDELGKDECKRVVQRLSRCAFPFQCAHGRPSLVPLVDIGLGGRVGGWEASSLSADRWKNWLGELS
ncbi:DNA mismatch repair protein [Metarhizium robertsii]|uniref:Peptidase S8/S53, subtilisin/kexin/sedolisin n=2 Tax=Metarhizium robertsii TaxID=568076 RepID=A0A0B2XIP0_METRA|nr:Peptidase S8/S53, subtilisin/kexin/sedolisin [Metarhizium robertsii ARSEF 23]EXU97917.1 DNA mismatch repair protein [Metarhizium robertsii]KHO11794.1 Peptidase S8/S53, subtilisin/kexin/sedolisin [Metarhizium robertsii ARSEF 23]